MYSTAASSVAVAAAEQVAAQVHERLCVRAQHVTHQYCACVGVAVVFRPNEARYREQHRQRATQSELVMAI
eukprot:9251-Heterococcus_DN1.PRE.4